MVVSHRFCQPGSYWADVVAPDFHIVAVTADPISAARIVFHAFATHLGDRLNAEQPR
jgi:hypothetical protein